MMLRTNTTRIQNKGFDSLKVFGPWKIYTTENLSLSNRKGTIQIIEI